MKFEMHICANKRHSNILLCKLNILLKCNFFFTKNINCLSRFLQLYLFWRVNCASSVYCFFLHRVVMRPRMIFFELDYFFRLHVVLSNLDPVFAFVRPSDVVARTDLELGLKIKATLINWLMCCGRIFPSLINH